MPPVELTFPSGFSHLKLVRALLHEVCAGADVDMAEMHWMVQATDEAVSNCVRHAYAGSKDQPIRIRIVFEDHTLEVSVSDSGKAFDFRPDEAFDPDRFDGAGSGGLGLHMIRKVADRVSYASEKGTNTLVIQRRLRGMHALSRTA